MSMKYLGKQFDIHTGGIDHIQIHHTNEIAQSEGATGEKWVNYWLHNEFLVMDKGKMSKSSGNFLTLQYVIDQGYDALDYRFFLLGGHYRSQLTFSWESMEGAKNARKSLLKQVAKLVESAGPAGNAAGTLTFEATIAAIPADSPARAYLDRFKAAIEADLNTPRAFSELQGLVRDAKIPAKDALTGLEAMDSVLGLALVKSALAQIEAQKAGAAGGASDPRIDALIAERAAAKKAKNFARADEIRNQLKTEGILLEDSPSGTTWKRI
jgi:cysteinyl-tRNA synthetase